MLEREKKCFRQKTFKTDKKTTFVQILLKKQKLAQFVLFHCVFHVIGLLIASEHDFKGGKKNLWQAKVDLTYKLL